MQSAIRVFAILCLSILGAAAPVSSFAQTVFDDPDFVEVTIPRPDGSGWSGVVGLLFSDDGGRGYAWEREGRVWILDEASPATTPLIDISEEVLGWRDFGLLGFALDPDFATNGHIYLYYVVDRHHLEHCVEPGAGVGPPVCDGGYNASTTIKATRAVIGRITRYTAIKPPADPDFSNAVTVDYNTRKVLVGETPQTGFPILHQSHGTGHIVFGTDGTLLAACGDAASYSSTDVGSAGETAYAEGLADGIIKPKENVGAYRSQLVDSLNGKIIRIDPATGDGIPGNPFYDAANPRSPASRVWSLGLRNPYRMALRPDTGSHDPALANPGTIYIGDVGWGTWEDWQVANAPGQNFGWPSFEGLTKHSGYDSNSPTNQDASDALGCDVSFRDLIQQDTVGLPSFPNPCGAGDITTFPTFVHERPKLDWRHGQDKARYPAFDSADNAVAVLVGDPIPGTSTVLVSGTPFRGNAATGGVWYTGDDFPGDYKDTYFMGDYGGQWIKNVTIGGGDNAAMVRPFISNAGGVVFLATHPVDGALYYISWASSLRKVDYAPGGNRPPDAVATASVSYGASPLTVDFVGDGSSDPEATALSYDWDFGDGSAPSTEANPQHTFTAPDANPVSYTVTLAVTDSGSPPANDVDQILISVNNTPPDVTITSPVDGALYPITGDTTYDLRADITDAEHGPGELTCAWQTVLHHNDHTHADPIDYNCDTSTQIAPLGCGAETYFFRVHLTVTDADGLATSKFSTLLPDCPGNTPPIANDDSATVDLGDSVDIDLAANDTDDSALDLDSIEIVTGPAAGSVAVQPGTGVVTYTSTGATGTTDTFTYTIRDLVGAISNAADVTVTISDTVSTPAMSPDGGTYFSPQLVSLSSATGGATIYYTLDGTDPDEGSAAYTGSPILLDVDTTLKARAFKTGLNSSLVASAAYVFADSPVNIAPLASVTASSEYNATYAAANAVDGIADGAPSAPDAEWATYHEKAGGWLDLNWGGVSYLVGQIVLYDRPNSVDQVTGATISFSDGSSVPVAALSNDGTPLTIDLTPARSITSLRFTVDSVSASTRNTGISEIEVYGEAVNLPPVADDDSATVFEGQSIVIPVLDNDSDDQGLDPGSVTVVSLPSAGFIAAIDPATGDITYSHGGGTETTDSFTYTVRDLDGELSNEAAVDISIAPYVPPTVTILSPTEGQVVTDPTVIVVFEKLGDESEYNHVHVRLDSDPYTAIHDMLVTSFDFGAVAPGSHSINVWLVNADHSPLTNPEANAVVNFEVGVTAPAMSPGGGTYTTPQLVSLSTPTIGATIYYTLDGSDPDEGSAAYTGAPILIDVDSTLKARAFAVGATPSTISSASYVFVSPSDNIAPFATVIASSEYSATYAAVNAIDGVADGAPSDPDAEWASNREKAGAWLDLDWVGVAYDVTQIVLYDRPNTVDRVTSATISFSDGSSVAVGALPDGGAPVTIDLTPPRSITSLRFTVDSVSSSTKNVGLSEIEVYGTLSGPQAPTADAGADITAVDLDGSGDEPVSLDGSASTDSDGVIVNYRWSESGSVLADGPSSTVSVDMSVGTHTVSLEVTDNDGLTASDTVVVTVDPPPPNSPPVVNAGPDQTVTVIDQLHLHDATVTDDGLPVSPGTVSVMWTFVDGPATPTWPLGDQDNIHTHVEFPAVGLYTLRLTADDGELTAFDEVVVDVTGDVAAPVMTPGGGTFTAPVLVSLSSSTSGAIIYYTLDGTDPDESSAAYAGSPILIDIDATLKARAYKTGLTPSAITSADYVFIAAPANVAPLASVAASSEYNATYAADNAVDGIADGAPGAPDAEWATFHEKAGGWLDLDWGGASYLVSQIVVYDRPNSVDQVTSATISFSDGSSAAVGALPNGGAPVTIDLTPPRSITSLRFTVDSVSSSTRNTGISEIEVYGTPD